MRDPRNRQLLVFLAMAAWWRPAYVLMENVHDTLKKDDGAYAKVVRRVGVWARPSRSIHD